MDFLEYLRNACQRDYAANPPKNALLASQDHFYRGDADRIKNYLPWYNYTMNAYLGSPAPGVEKAGVLKLSKVKHPAETFVFTEESALLDERCSAILV
jgi:hypothetical protein